MYLLKLFNSVPSFIPPKIFRGLRLLAWPIWAVAPFGQARRAPPFLSALSVILPYIAPLLLLLETYTEAYVAVAVTGGAVAAQS